MRPPATKGNKKRDKLGDKMTRPREGGHTIQHQGGHLKKALRNPNSTLFEKMQNQTTHRPQRETRRKTSWETSWETRRKGDTKGETKPREGGRTIQHRHTCGKTMEDKERQDLGKGGTPSNTGTRVGRQWETRGNKTSGDKPLGEADAPSNTNAYCEETMGGKGRRGETRGDKTSGRRIRRPTQAGRTRPHPTQAHVWGDNGKHWETRPSERRTHHLQWATKGNKTLGKADTPSNKGKQEGAQHPTKGKKKGYNRRQEETRPCWERWRHHPTKGNKKGYNGRQRENPTTETRKSTMGDKRRQVPRKGGRVISVKHYLDK